MRVDGWEVRMLVFVVVVAYLVKLVFLVGVKMGLGLHP